MSKPTVQTPATASAAAKPILEGIQKAFGMIPNLYGVIGNSGPALQANLDFGKKLEEGVFDFKHAEIIKLAASEVNACHYCLSAHTAILKNTGLTDEETLQIRQGTHPDPKINAIATLTREIVAERGYPSQAALENFATHGFGPDALVEVVAVIALNTMNNYINHLSDTPIDWPKPAELPTPLNA